MDGAVSLADAATGADTETVKIAGVSITPSVSGVGRNTLLRSVLVASVGRSVQQLDNSQAGRDGQDGSAGGIRDVQAVRAIRSVIDQMDGSENELYAGVLYAKSKTAVEQTDPFKISILQAIDGPAVRAPNIRSTPKTRRSSYRPCPSAGMPASR